MSRINDFFNIIFADYVINFLIDSGFEREKISKKASMNIAILAPIINCHFEIKILIPINFIIGASPGNDNTFRIGFIPNETSSKC